MALRKILVGLIVLATIGFVIGTSIEKGNDHHDAPAASSTGSEAGHAEGSGAEATPAETGGETATEHAAENAGATETHGEFKPLGINLESTPLILLAALGSLLLAGAAWARSRMLALLLVVVLAMGVFAALDVAEVIHQFDIDETGLGVLAAVVALLHVAAAFVALRMAEAARA
jgi:hypothetical protein